MSDAAAVTSITSDYNVEPEFSSVSTILQTYSPYLQKIEQCREWIGSQDKEDPNVVCIVVMKQTDVNSFLLLGTVQARKENPSLFNNLRAEIRTLYGTKTVVLNKIAHWDTIVALINQGKSEYDEIEENKKREYTDGDESEAEKLLRVKIEEAVIAGASDVSFLTRGDHGHMVMQVDGLMTKPQPLVPLDITAAVSSALQMKSEEFRGDFNEQNIVNKNITLDIRPRINGEVKVEKVRLRSISVPAHNGFSFTSRIIRTSQKNKFKLHQLGFTPSQLKLLGWLTNQPSGIFIVCAPTNNGKTVTLHGFYENMPPERRIITFEDPVEYLLEHPQAVQEPINEEAGISAFSLAKSSLRQASHAIGISELRDPDITMECINSALTGHLMATTLHVHDALSAPERLKRLGVSPDTLALKGLFKAVLAQRLLPKLCESCKIKEHNEEYGTYYVQNEKGCDACGGGIKGVKGRVLVAEVLVFSSGIRQLLKEGRTAEIESFARSEGFTSMLDMALEKIKAGVVDPKHVFERLGDSAETDTAEYNYGTGEFYEPEGV